MRRGAEIRRRENLSSVCHHQHYAAEFCRELCSGRFYALAVSFSGDVNAPGLRIPALCPFCPLSPPSFGPRVSPSLRGQKKPWQKVSGCVWLTHRAHWSEIQEAGRSEGRGQRATSLRNPSATGQPAASVEKAESFRAGALVKAILARLAPTLVSVKQSAKCQQISSNNVLSMQSPHVAACSPSAGLILIFILFILCDHSLNHL